MRVLFAFTLTLGLAGCRATPLTNAQTSADALAREVLSALARNDESRLRALALNEQEFKSHVWPELPAARPERNLPFSYVWGDLRQKSDTSLRSILTTHRGRRYELLRVTYADKVTQYPGFRVHREAIFSVRDSAGAEQELRVCGSLVEKGGSWKVFSYVVDD